MHDGDLTKLPPEVEQMKSKKILGKAINKKKKIENPDETTYQVQKVSMDVNIIDEFQKLHNLQEVFSCTPK